ncbi:MAG TPA: nucleoside triphosphate pyrophosphohydrolase [Clostridiaceae bacterium]
MINIVGLGPGAKEAITLGALEALKDADVVLLRTIKHPTVNFLKEYDITYETFDESYETKDSFKEVYDEIALEVLEKAKIFNNVAYAVPGHPLVAEKSVVNLINLCKENGIEYKIIPSVSFIDAIFESLEIDPSEGFKLIDAFDINKQLLDKRSKLIISQVYNKFIASEVKLTLMEYYNDDTKIYFIRAAGIKGQESIREIPLFCLDRQEDIDYLTSIYIPESPNKAVDFNDLLEIMDKLMGEEGCPWDKEQDHVSLKRYLIEECYEVLEAIDNKNEGELLEELGDVLLQVVFHAAIGKKEGYFNIKDVIKSICDKMINRHPHIFGNIQAETSLQVLQNWDEIKKKEKGYESYAQELKHIGKNLPALLRAEKVQAKAGKVGFDFPSIEIAMDKVTEELIEVKSVYKGLNQAKILEEIGNLIFSSVNIARFLDIDPENALNYTIDKFIGRFEQIEKSTISSGKKLEDMTIYEMDCLWEKTKV